VLLGGILTERNLLLNCYEQRAFSMQRMNIWAPYVMTLRLVFFIPLLLLVIIDAHLKIGEGTNETTVHIMRESGYEPNFAERTFIASYITVIAYAFMYRWACDKYYRYLHY
jgi:hypothetical protein